MSATDLELLARYTLLRAEDAFAQLVRRHLDLVYSAALRHVRSPQLAEEVAQSAFADLARQAHRLAPQTILVAWLYQVTRRTAINLARSEARRLLREQTATEMIAMNATASGWTHIEPLLDEAVSALDDTDRAAVLLRYFENRPLREVGEHLGVSEDAAQKRVSRAVERLREYFSKRGVTIGAGGLAALISTNAVQSAPVGLAVTISAAAALAGKTIAATATQAIAMTTLQKTVIGAALAAAVGTGIYEARQASQQRDRVQALGEQHAEQIHQLQQERDDAVKRLAASSARPTPRLPAPPVQLTVPAPEPSDASQFTNMLDRFPSLKAKAPNKLSGAQLESYLQANQRNAASLLAAYRTAGDPVFLSEAMQKYGNDPRVALEATLRKDAPPEERRQWLETFKQSNSNNALPNYFSALDYFRAGQTDQAVQELVAASGKKAFQDYSRQRTQDNEQAYLAAGYAPAEAKAIAPLQQAIYCSEPDAEVEEFVPFQSQMTQFAEMKALGVSLSELSKSYRQAGDQASALAAQQMAVDLGQRYRNVARDELGLLVSMNIELIALHELDPNSRLVDTGQTVQDYRNQLNQQRAALRGLYRQAVPLLGAMSDQDWISYGERARDFGEQAALQWVLGKYGPK
jgi:RNA polymerase sigma factor (sigma-70 family)